ncbi:MAG TPA: M56 family metallopeptidase [Candidatus Angelobacter sp.]|nr:M56 family metallopeptidase [Candidatus Angelobacter sp.]
MNVLATALSSWGQFGSALANHLWQSTVFAAFAALLTLLLRKNHARMRYWLWLAGSLKFLLPFALLVSVGARLHGREQASAPQSQVSIVMDQITRTFAPAHAPHAPAAGWQHPATASPILLLIIVTVWFIGFAALIFFWFVRWRRIIRAIRQSQPIEPGREIGVLRTLERRAGITSPTRLLRGNSTLEPGIVGIVRPVMFLPVGIADRLNDSQLSAVMMHELCHLRRRDNLGAALHMFVEALFWFHPFVWWIGSRLVDERERACDEEVLLLGSEAQAYAEGILKVCEFYLETPLACVAGVTGSNLKKRIEAIMIHRIARKLAIGKKLLLSALAVAAIAGPIALGLFHPQPSHAQAQGQSASAGPAQIESASIQPSEKGDNEGPVVRGRVVSSRMMFRPESFKAENVTLNELVRAAFGIQSSQIVGGPNWDSTRLFDVDVKFTNTGADHIQRVTETRLALQALLTDRFKLETHHELKQLPVYVLTVGPDGSKLTEVRGKDASKQQGLMQESPGHFIGTSARISTLISVLEYQLGVPLVDKTGLRGSYDFKLTADWPQTRPLPEDPAPLLRAVSEQLGLELKPATDLVEVLVIDHAEPVKTEQKGEAARMN